MSISWLPMIFNIDFLLPHLEEKMRLGTRDASRHVLCPACRRRTKLYHLSDGRRKCSVCNGKFTLYTRKGDLRLRQQATLLLCYCLDFPALRVATITGERHRLISDAFRQFRELIARQTLTPEQIRLLSKKQEISSLRYLSECSVCRRLARTGSRQVVFGVKKKMGKVILEPFLLLPDTAGSYNGFVCHGAFHRIQEHSNEVAHDGLELFWVWVTERLRPHHGVLKRNLGLYLKELEWKYNHRHLSPQMQAMRLMLLLPAPFL